MAQTVPDTVERAIKKTRLATLEYSLELKARKWIVFGLTVGIIGLSAVDWAAYDQG